jgi:hypothetical protein
MLVMLQEGKILDRPDMCVCVYVCTFLPLKSIKSFDFESDDNTPNKFRFSGNLVQGGTLYGENVPPIVGTHAFVRLAGEVQ